jgi:hypothetical protein
MRLLKAKPTEDELRNLNEKRRKRALTRWERLRVQNEPADTDERSNATTSSRKHCRKSRILKKGKGSSSSSSGSESESDETERDWIDRSAPRTARDVPTPAKRLQQMEQANAMSRFFDNLGGREA